MDKSRFGPFALEERLGDNSTGTVFRALHLQQKRLVALKVFPAPLVATSPAAKAALVKEIETLKKLQHPNIARCWGGLLEQSHGCIASELIEGETLAALLARRNRLSWDNVVEYAAQISSALEHAHAGGIVHQDLQPDKVLIAANDQLKIIDFRMERATNPTCTTSQRRTMERVKYQSPEQLRGETQLTQKTDLYSLGCMMFEMLVGYPPFTGDSIEDVARKHQEEKPPRVDALVMDCPVWLDSLIGQMLDKDPLRRPYSAQAVSFALQETHQKVAAKTSVLEHAAGGFSTLQSQADKGVARDLLAKARREVDKKVVVEAPPVWERPWFLVVCLTVMLGGLATFFLWPVSEEGLFRNAQALMLTDDEGNWDRARSRYLEPLLAKFPQGQYADESQAYIDQIDMRRAERKLKLNKRFNREPSSEGERLYAEALGYEVFGDRFTALERYDSMINLLKDHEADRPFANLARRQKAAIEKVAGTGTSAQFIEEQLKKADDLAANGKSIDARRIWNDILTLYGDNREFGNLVAQAQDRLSSKHKSKDSGEKKE